MFAKRQLKSRKPNDKRSRTLLALLFGCVLLSVLRVESIVYAQEPLKAGPQKASATSFDSKKEPQPQDQATPPDANSTDIKESSDPHQAKLLRDARRLQILSREVQAEIVNSKPDTLSSAAIKKLDELQKLATTVKAEIGNTH